MDYDLAIVGSGSVGAAAGYYAALAGLRVALFDSHSPPHRLGGHHGDTRIIRHAGAGGEIYTPLALRAQLLWQALEEISALPLFHRCGVLNLAPRDTAFLREIHASAHAHGIAIRPLDRAALRERWPTINAPENYAALLEPDAGYLKCHLAIATLLEKAAELGAHPYFDCPLHAVQAERDGVRLLGPRGEWRARRVALCAGAWVRALLPTLPLQTRCKPFAWYQADARFSERRHFPALHAMMPQGARFYSFPAVDGALKAGRYDGGLVSLSPSARCPSARDVSEDIEIHDYLRAFLPQTGDCLYGDIASVAMTPDGHFIIDTLPSAPAISIVSGLGANGFKFATALGELVVRMATGAEPGYDLTPFRLSRFAPCAG
ncbi:N-methyl-L-tryptophan oxidase [Edwardsiella anguillarum]|uniref:N-methyl-L-tryptophan oxidase n=1 Tax=Edwardsiella anguillarum TaxID=1821960 RepID=UPI0024B8366A|nr:N-methyl-L-tryptophan oxidase [Edwardsiella anguillarum]WHP78977.1 N-methyl-L-tryptophan oxidase [Edwardsiella anguillarum]WHQ15405.1 N-methyl-L-tryptophan oxidase [Edwardsiella anguillarum]WHQ16434.1 N-methyl-L-tryptophan oxidase [Edwardsiella anguillarum]WHQ19969.1 N-methyl-L-tryptophan oxidase [Edwardsiella anguillarum]WHQ23490.1 N-methyl-L-tryptophan oxidase [Edwardsiella anguillarum]